MSEQRLRFDNGRGQELSARLVRPAGRPVAFALFAHCFTCSKDLKAASAISAALAEAGIATLRFDFTGLGESAGDFADTTFSSNVDDLVAAAGYLETEYGIGPDLLVGHSFGGAAVLQAAHRVDSCRAVVTIGSPCDPEHVTHLLASSAEQIARDGQARVQLAGRSFTIRREFLRDLEETRMQETIAGLRRALLVMHAPLDDIVGVDNAARIFEAARHPKSFVSLDGADHLLRDQVDAHYAGRVAAAWATRYLSGAEPGLLEGVTEDCVVAEIGRDHYRVDVMAGSHRLLADEPAEVGGTDTGPGPYDLLLAALGACTAMTLRMYADRKRWELDGVRVRLRHAKIHARDCEACETKEGMVDRVEREIELRGRLDADQRARLAQIADRCPVHRTLHGEVQVRTRLQEPGEGE